MRDQQTLIKLSRDVRENLKLVYQEAHPDHTMEDLIPQNIMAWARHTFPALFAEEEPFRIYNNPQVNNGVFILLKNGAGTTSVALLSDWASNTPESHNIAKQVGEVEYSIHLGDTYYVGNEEEIIANFNKEESDETPLGPWVYGKFGSFAMMGNHEMYSGALSYYNTLLPWMGQFVGNQPQQEASFFCLESEFWKIIGLDTGQDSLVGFAPNFLLELHEEQVNWLKNTVKINEGNKGIIFLTHHQFISDFEKPFKRVGKQLSELIDPTKTVLWFWGHAHRFEVYGANKLPKNGATFFGRCIGHGGMPVELQKKNLESSKNNLVLYDNRLKRTIKKNIHLGFNGFSKFNINDHQLEIQYFDENIKLGEPPRLIMTETWEIDINTGQLSGKDILLAPIDEIGELTLVADNIKKAITPELIV